MKITAVLLATAAAIAVFVAAQAGSAATSGPIRLQLLDIPKSDTPVGAAAQHRTPQAGDQVLLTDELYAWNGAKRGAHLGRAEAALSFRTGFSFEKGGLVYIVGQLFLPGGTITVDGFATVGSGSSPFVLPIVGGTGKYIGARGTFSSRDIGADRNKSSVTLTLVDGA